MIAMNDDEIFSLSFCLLDLILVVISRFHWHSVSSRTMLFRDWVSWLTLVCVCSRVNRVFSKFYFPSFALI